MKKGRRSFTPSSLAVENVQLREKEMGTLPTSERWQAYNQGRINILRGEMLARTAEATEFMERFGNECDDREGRVVPSALEFRRVDFSRSNKSIFDPNNLSGVHENFPVNRVRSAPDRQPASTMIRVAISKGINRPVRQLG